MIFFNDEHIRQHLVGGFKFATPEFLFSVCYNTGVGRLCKTEDSTTDQVLDFRLFAFDL